MSNQNSEVDVNVLIKLYNQKLASLSNQNILLEAKLQTLTQDYSTLEEKYNELFTEKELELLEKHDLLLNGNITLTIKNWKKLIETNNYINKIPNKYLIKIKYI